MHQEFLKTQILSEPYTRAIYYIDKGIIDAECIFLSIRVSPQNSQKV